MIATTTNGAAHPHARGDDDDDEWRDGAMPDALASIATTGNELLACDAGEPEWVVDGAIEQGDVVMLTGREKEALKTWLVLTLAICTVTGRHWLGRTVRRQSGRALIISAETSRRNIARRISALCTGMGLDPHRVAGRIVVVDRPITMIPIAERDRVSDEADLATRVTALRQYDPDRRKQITRTAEAVAQRRVAALGAHLDALDAIEQAPDGTWSIIVIDTLRQCLAGDENSSRDAGRYTQATRDLARFARCPVISVHHTNKSGDGADARGARGSVELTAGPDVLLSIDTGGDHPTMHARLRNHEAPEPIGYALELGEDGAARIVIREPARRKGKAGATVDDGEVLEVLRAALPAALTASRIRSAVAEARGGRAGGKASADAVARSLSRLVAASKIVETEIQRGRGEPMPGYRWGTDDTPDVARRRITTTGTDPSDPEDV